MSFSKVQSTSGESSGLVSSFGLAYGTNPTSGNLLVVLGSCSGHAGALPASMALSDTIGNSWTQDCNQSDSTSGSKGFIAIWHCTNKSTGADTVTLTPNTGTYVTSLCVYEFSFSGTLAVDGTPTSAISASTVTSYQPGSITLSATDLVFGGSTWSNTAGGNTFSTTSSGFVVGENNPGASGNAYCVIYNLACSAASINVNTSFTLGGECVGGAVAFKAAAAATSGPPYWSGSIHRPRQRPALTGAAFDRAYN